MTERSQTTEAIPSLIAAQAKICQAKLDWINASRKLERLRAQLTQAESSARVAKFRLEALEVANGR